VRDRVAAIYRSIYTSIDALTEFSGRLLAWLLPMMVLLTLAIVILRYLFDIGTVATQEVVVYMHGASFMLGLAYALKQGAHVRVDVLANRMSPRLRIWVDLCGHLLFLLPLCGCIIWFSWDYVAAAWRVHEGSPEVGGLPGIYLLKTLLPLAATLLALQGVAEIARCLRFLHDE
jgi:TRAP-type mannitol/chloroaromatic compound transport system permease small subunit